MEGFGDVVEGDLRGRFDVGDGLSDFDSLEIGARRKGLPLGILIEELFGGCSEMTILSDLVRAEVGVVKARIGAITSGLSFVGIVDERERPCLLGRYCTR